MKDAIGLIWLVARVQSCMNVRIMGDFETPKNDIAWLRWQDRMAEAEWIRIDTLLKIQPYAT